MRRYSSLLMALLLAMSAQASESTSSSPSKPIRSASAKDDASSSASASSGSSREKEKDSKDSKKSSKDSKDSKDKDGKEAIAAEELASRIAERLAVLKKEKEEAARAPAARPVVRPSYVPLRRSEGVKAKAPEGGEHGGAALVAAMGGAGAVHWSYQGEGAPANWGKLGSANAKCDSGDRQSPIDIRDGIKVELDPIVFDYKPSGFNVLDNGHTIQVNVGSGNYISVMGHSYELVQFHFHKPSEERVNGRAYEMVMHLVHKDADGKYAVIAVLIERGKAHSTVQQVWNNLPLEKNDPQAALQPMDLMTLLPPQRGYYTYMGSLTTPPCTEGVLWMVMKDPVELSADQIAIFGRLYPMNARPLQKTSGRLIKESN